MGLTLRQAAEQCGASRTTINRALKSGKLSGSRTDAGAWSIDPAELARVFPWDVTGLTKWDTRGHSRDGAGERESVLAVRVELLEQQLERERDTVEDLRRRLDKAEDRVLALTPPPERPPQGTLWGRLRYVLRGTD